MDFEGIDWTELSKYFGIVKYDYESGKDKEVLLKTKEYLQNILFSNGEQEVATALRMFLNKLYENSKNFKCNAPIWKGLLEIEDDFTFIKYSIILLDQMWY